MTQHAATAIAAGFARQHARAKKVMLNGSEIGSASSWYGVQVLLRAQGKGYLCRDLWETSYETPAEFIIGNRRAA